MSVIVKTFKYNVTVLESLASEKKYMHTNSCIAKLTLRIEYSYSKTCLRQPLKNRRNKDCSLMKVEPIEGEHSAILMTCIK